MARPAKAPAKKTSPVVWVALVAGAVAVYMLTGSEGAPKGDFSVKKKKSSATAAGEFTEADYTTKFPPVTLAAVDAFRPGIVKAQPSVIVAKIDPALETGHPVPSNLTGGDPNWYYTGTVTLNGASEALLENPTLGESEYVRPGERWKQARVASIDIAAVTLIGPDGKSVDVPKQPYGEVPGGSKTAVAANAPLGVPTGPIAGTIGGRPLAGPQGATMSNGTLLPLPPANGTVTQAPQNDNNQNTRRQRRRARQNNQTFGDPNNGF